jgi:hypothetical protein
MTGKTANFNKAIRAMLPLPISWVLQWKGTKGEDHDVNSMWTVMPPRQSILSAQMHPLFQVNVSLYKEYLRK